jgi:hypothetical protein
MTLWTSVRDGSFRWISQSIPPSIAGSGGFGQGSGRGQISLTRFASCNSVDGQATFAQLRRQTFRTFADAIAPTANFGGIHGIVYAAMHSAAPCRQWLRPPGTLGIVASISDSYVDRPASSLLRDRPNRGIAQQTAQEREELQSRALSFVPVQLHRAVAAFPRRLEHDRGPT